jgi:hypothetical protein
MNIPYYYNSGYDDDGVNIYTCLKCGDKIYVRSHYQPNFCPYCGVEYKGEKENIGNNAKRWYGVCFTERFYWAIDERTVEMWGEPWEEDQWVEKNYYRHDRGQTPQKILAEKRKLEKEDQAEMDRQIADHHRIQNLRREKDPNFDEGKAKNEKAFTSKKEFRIVRKKEFQRHSIMVRKDIYLAKTGKEFNEYKEDRLPYNAKPEITTGIAFLPDGNKTDQKKCELVK